jgi:hypothetical protein
VGRSRGRFGHNPCTHDHPQPSWPTHPYRSWRVPGSAAAHAHCSLGSAIRLVPLHSGVVASGHLEQGSASLFLPPDRFPKSCFQCRPRTSCTVLPQAGSAVRGLSTNDVRRRWFPGCGTRWWIHPMTLSAAVPVPPHVVEEQDRSACKVPQQGITTHHTHALHGAVHDDKACSGGGGIASSPSPGQKRAICTLQSCAFEALEQEIDGLTD